ncbi:MAG: hypothetical protein EOQ40_13085 [Mesorhizobium sp.]|nr:MAG: hypothetical protein EOQ40_13085 [Mesorhizobium sp.]
MIWSASLEGALTELLVAVFGSGTRIAHRQPLSRRAACVSRLFLGRPSGNPGSVIIKHVPAERFVPGAVPDAPEFREEQVVHRFLAGIGAESGLKPALLGFDPAGLLLLEDLGPIGNPVARSFAELVPRLARAMARLHGRTLDQETTYLELRRQAGLGPVATDGRCHGVMREAERAADGRAGLASMVSPWETPAVRRTLEREFDAVVALVENYPGRRALIHDDLGNARQTFEIGTETYLLDFEYSHYAPPFYELTKTLLGKFETNTETGEYLLASPKMPLALAEQHRVLMNRDYGLRLADEEWEETLAACLIYAALTLLGNLAATGHRRTLRGSVQDDINRILDRLTLVLRPFRPFAVIRSIVTRYRAAPAAPNARKLSSADAVST